MEKKSKKKYLIGALAVLLVAVAVGGTIAWLTAANNVTNQFTVGQIEEPTTPPGNLPGPDDPNYSEDKHHLSGNIYEIFEDDSKIIPGDSIQKEPYVGLGKGSENAFVFAYVDNDMMDDEAKDSTYFILNTDAWQPTNKSVKYEGVQDAYTGGLFIYKGDSGTNISPSGIGYLTASADNDVWTSRIFREVVIPEDLNVIDFNAVEDESGNYTTYPTMDVWCYIYAVDMEDKAQSLNDAISSAEAWCAAPMAIAGAVETTDEP